MNLYSVRDNLAEVFNKPFTEINDATAKRVFSDSIQENPHKDDFTLYFLGFYNDNSGTIENVTPLRILNGTEVKLNTPSMQNQIPTPGQ